MLNSLRSKYYGGQTPRHLKSPNSRFLFIWFHAENFSLSRRVPLISVLCLPSTPYPTTPPSVKVNNCDSRLFTLVSNLDAPLLLAFGWGEGTRSCFFEAWEMGTRGEGQLIGKILLLIRAITHCHNYQCHQRVCNGFLVASRDSRTPSVLHMLPITLPDWIYANWTKIKSHLRGEPSWDSFALTNTHTHKLTSHSTFFCSFIISAVSGKAQHLPRDPPHFHCLSVKPRKKKK